MAYVAGHSQGVSFTLDGGGLVELNVRAHDWEEFVKELETTHTGSAGIEAVIAGLLGGRGNVEANVDAAALVNATSPGVKAGAKGSLNFKYGGATGLIAHVMITKLHWRTVVDGLVTYSFACRIDSTSGTYTRPT